jgi:CheY-specific phosphatase CheX
MSRPGASTVDTTQLRDLLECVVERAGGFLWEQIGLPAEFGRPDEPKMEEKRLLIATFPVTGSLQGRITVRAAEGVVQTILKAMIPEPVPVEEEELMLQETLKETLNIIIGSSTEMLRQRGYPIEVFPPFATVGDETAGGFDQDHDLTLHTPAGSMYFVLSIVSR